MRILVLAVAIASVGLMALAGWRVFWPAHRISFDNILKIRNGMTLAEVETILGAPPGNYSTTGRMPPAVGPDAYHPTPHYESWVADEASVTFWFDEEGRVVMEASCSSARGASLLDYIRVWLGW